MTTAETRYDSRPETYQHISSVRTKLQRIAFGLLERGRVHDASKLVEPELAVFDEYTPKLKASTYGSDEYASFLEGMREGLAHHYKVNDHHPEFRDGTLGWMSLMQLTEMLCDWMAACERHDDGDIRRSIEINAERFGYGDEIKTLLYNTVEALEQGWV